MTKKPMQITTPLFEGVVCATCLKGHPKLRMIPDLPGQPFICPPCYAKIVPPAKKEKEITHDSNYTANPLFE